MLCVVVKTTSETLNKFNRQYPLRLSIVMVLADPHLYPDFLDHCCKFYIFSVHPLDKVTNDIAEQ